MAEIQSLPALADGGGYHYKSEVVRKDLNEDGEATESWSVVVGRRDGDTKYVRFKGPNQTGFAVTRMFHRTYGYRFSEMSKNFNVYGDEIDYERRAKVGLPRLDPVADVLGRPALLGFRRHAVSDDPRYPVEAALSGGGYQVVSENEDQITFQLPDADRFTLSKQHGLAVVERTWISNGSKTTISNGDWKQFSDDRWLPGISNVSFFNEAGDLQTSISYRNEPLPMLTSRDMEPIADREGWEIAKVTSEEIGSNVDGARVNPNDLVRLEDVANGKIDLGLLRNSQIGSRTIRLVVWMNVLLIVAVGGFELYRRIKTPKSHETPDHPGDGTSSDPT